MAKKPNIETVAKRWIELKSHAKELEKELAELKPILEGALLEAPEKSLELCGWRFLLVEFDKENFTWSKAKTELTPAVLAKLEPYLSTSQVVQIRTSWQGGEKEAA